MTATVSYRKTRSGEWVAYGPSSVVKAMHYVSVTRRDGTASQVIIERTGRPFTVDGTEMVYGYISRDVERAYGRRGGFDMSEYGRDAQARDMGAMR